jgi:3D-(3,5/4)-trihydroxycyclohexane-1,2-dione acylhydrolase (decyclizing)
VYGVRDSRRLGVKLAEPEREVVVMVGDGSYLMMNSEIVTAVGEGIRLTIVLVDNHGYQCILGLQRAVGVSDFGNELRYRDRGTKQLTGEYSRKTRETYEKATENQRPLFA